jgi:hypothetical protein
MGAKSMGALGWGAGGSWKTTSAACAGTAARTAMPSAAAKGRARIVLAFILLTPEPKETRYASDLKKHLDRSWEGSVRGAAVPDIAARMRLKHTRKVKVSCLKSGGKMTLHFRHSAG